MVSLAIPTVASKTCTWQCEYLTMLVQIRLQMK